LKRWVLRASFKEGRVGDCRMWMGRVFQREGTATEKALSPQVPSLVLGTDKQFVSADLRRRVGVWRGRRRLER